MTEGVFNCLIDKTRTQAFANAIKNTVRPGDVVVDMGTGSGILAMLAVKSGADLVYAVENDPNNIKTLESTFLANDCDGRIKIISGDVTSIDLPENVDVIIGEMISTALIEELQIPAMNNMLRFTKKDVRVLLEKYDTYAELVFNNDVFNDLTFNIFRYEYPDLKDLRSKSHSVKFHISHFRFFKSDK